jgi:hypothetical protein
MPIEPLLRSLQRLSPLDSKVSRTIMILYLMYLNQQSITAKFFILLFLLVSFCTIASSLPNNALAQVASPSAHVFKFYLDPSLVTDMQFAKLVLPKYVDDMNYILAKNTNQLLTFNPESDIILTTIQPQSDNAFILPTQGYEVWAHASASAIPTYPYSYGGTMSFDQSGAAVLANLHWTRLYNPEVLLAGSEEMHDYWIQIDHMLHEFAHVFGAGNGEYYNLAQNNDSTGISPLLNINVYDSQDTFWSDKTDFFTDPLLWLAYGNIQIGNPTSRSALLTTVKYANLTSYIMRGNYRNPTYKPPTVDLQHITLHIVDNETQLPISDAQVKVWNVQSIPNDPTQLQYDTSTDSTGTIVFAWGGASDPHNNYDFLKLIKVFKSGYVSTAKYISIYDTDIQKLLFNKNIYETTIALNLDGAPTTTPTPSATATPTPTATPTVTTTPTVSDTTPPTVAITNPSNGAIVTKNTNVTISATASDNAGINKVEFFVNATLQCTDTTASYTCSWKVPNKAKVSYVLQAKAYDRSGNTATTSITVTSK